MKRDEKKCPYCAEIIKAEAIVCKHCGRAMTDPLPAPSVRKKSGCLKIGLYIFLGMAVLGGIIEMFESPEKKAEKARLRAEADAKKDLEKIERAKQAEIRKAEQTKLNEIRKEEQAKIDEERKVQREKDAMEKAEQDKIRAEERAKADEERRIRLEAEAEEKEKIAKIQEEEKAKALAAFRAIIDELKASGVVGKIEEKFFSVWVDPVHWSLMNRDQKEKLIRAFGNYFGSVSGLGGSSAYVYSYNNDEILGETKSLGRVAIYK